MATTAETAGGQEVRNKSTPEGLLKGWAPDYQRHLMLVRNANSQAHSEMS